MTKGSKAYAKEAGQLTHIYAIISFRITSIGLRRFLDNNEEGVWKRPTTAWRHMGLI